MLFRSEYMKYEKEILDIFNNNNIEEYTNNENLFVWIGNYYKNIEKDYDKMKEYYLMAIKKGNLIAIDNIKRNTTLLERYIYYKKNDIPLNEELTRDIHIYNNKLKMSKITDCGICMEDNKECIILNCFFHYVCTNCYIQLYDKPCSFCKL